MTAVAKWLVRSLAGIVALLAILTITVIVVLDSEAGTRWIIDEIDRRAPGQIEIDDFSGTLWQGLGIPLLLYSNVDRKVTATGLTLDISWSRTSPAGITFSDVSATTIEYRDLAAAVREPSPLTIAMSPLPISISIENIDVDRLEITTAERETNMRGAAVRGLSIVGSHFSASSAAISHEAGSLKLESIRVHLDGDVPATAKFDWQDNNRLWSGSGQLRGSLARLEFEHRLLGPYPATASGAVELLNRAEPLVDANVLWSSWSFDDYQATAGRVQFRGFLPSYEVDFQFRLADQSGRSAHLDVAAAGHRNGLPDINVVADTPAGRIEASGSVQWSPSLSANLRIGARELDLSQIAPVPKSAISTDLVLEINGRRNYEVTINSFDGIYNDERFLVRGGISRTDESWLCNGCELRVGKNRASVQGSIIDGRVAADLHIDAPQVDQLWPAFSGAATLDGVLRGSLNAPVFTGDATGNSLNVSNWYVDDFNVASRASTVEKVDIDASVKGLRRDDLLLGSFDVSLQGTPAKLEMDMGWVLANYSGEVSGTLDLDAEYPQGLVRTAAFRHDKTGIWRLASPFRVSSGPELLEFAAHDWTNGEASLALEQFRFGKGQTRLTARLDRMPLEVFEFWVPRGFELKGNASAGLDLRKENELWFGSLGWDQHQTKLRVTRTGEEPVDIVIPVVRVDAKLLGTSAEASASTQIEPGISAALQFTLADIAANPDMDARLTVDGTDWYWVPALFPQIDRFEGRISAAINGRGPLLDPNFSGELRWLDGQLTIPAWNVPVTDINLVVSGAASGDAIIKGGARAGEGTLSIDGRFDDLMRNSRSFSLHLSGENAELLNWPEYRLSASPDLNASGNPGRVSVSGRIDIPRAEIIVKQIPETAVRLSPDVVVVGREEPEKADVRVTGQADIVLGKNIHVRALGLDSKVLGQLRITIAENGSERAEGELTLVDGFFEAYGQRLTIAEGSLLFSGPLDNPFVNVRAERKIETMDTTVTAGIHLRGPAQNMVATIYSNPAMAESDALSYLVLGRPLEQATTTEGGELSGAAVALGLRQAARITNQIGQAFGLDQFEVTGDGGSTTSLVAGKQVSSRLYVRYAYGVFSQLGSILLRYRLSRRFTLETSTGESHSMDLLYIVEKP